MHMYTECRLIKLTMSQVGVCVLAFYYGLPYALFMH